MVTITFGSPEYLWFLLALPLLFATHFLLLRHTKRKALSFANFRVLKRATGNRYITKNYTVLLIRLAVITFAVLAVAQTVIWYEGETNENDYVIALDTSASMSAQDIPPSRLDAAKLYAREFAEALDGQTRLGLVSFSGITFIEWPLTKDRGNIISSLEEIEFEASGTDIPGAIITSTNLLVNTEKGRAIVLITDGSNTIETFQSRSVQRAVQYANVNRVKIYTVGVGTPNTDPIGYLPRYYNVSSVYNTENLQYIANATGGEFYDASSEEALMRAYEDIRAAERTSTLSFDLTPGLMLLALLLIMVEWGLVNTRFRMLP